MYVKWSFLPFSSILDPWVWQATDWRISYTVRFGLPHGQRQLETLPGYTWRWYLLTSAMWRVLAEPEKIMEKEVNEKEKKNWSENWLMLHNHVQLERLTERFRIMHCIKHKWRRATRLMEFRSKWRAFQLVGGENKNKTFIPSITFCLFDEHNRMTFILNKVTKITVFFSRFVFKMHTKNIAREVNKKCK